ncbi:MAG TPA: hypothetical protein VHA55_07105 [Pseudorhodoplanes sp.]|jgi:hypothetical protein|nr:hypothetical protein [Pseudorhodoplanes sp.]
MTRTFSAVLSAAALSALLALGSTAALAQAKTAKACEEEWTARKAELQAAKTKKKDFIAQCRAGTAAVTAPAAAPAKPVAAPAAGSEPAGKPGREAMVARERACGAEWKADKAAGKIPAGQTWPKYWSECNKRKKAQGM